MASRVDSSQQELRLPFVDRSRCRILLAGEAFSVAAVAYDDVDRTTRIRLVLEHTVLQEERTAHPRKWVSALLVKQHSRRRTGADGTLHRV
jgi:hypothetical protein